MILGYGIRLFSTLFSRNLFHRYKLTNEVYYIMIGVLASIVITEIKAYLFHNKKKEKIE